MDTSAICIIGPTGVGKTKHAFSLARELGGEVVNLDKIYTYKRFVIGTGLSDSLKETDVPKHLYQLIEPDQNIISPKKFAQMVRLTCEQIANRGHVPIIEGGSTTYFPALFKENCKHEFIKKFEYLYPQKKISLKSKILDRLEEMIAVGLIEEVEMGLRDYPHSLVMTDCHFIVPLVSYVKGESSLMEAKKSIVARCTEYIQYQVACFNKFNLG